VSLLSGKKIYKLLIKNSNKKKTSLNKGGEDMPLAFLREPSSTREVRLKRDWPDFLPRPTDDDIKVLAELSERNTGSSFFEKEKRGDKDGESATFDR
jgi:hypothetical protein